MPSAALKNDQVYFNAYLPGLLPPRNQPTLRVPSKRVETLILFGKKSSTYKLCFQLVNNWIT